MSPVFDPDAERKKRVYGMNGNNSHPNEIKLNDLYQEVILDHNKRPRNFKKIEDATSSAHGVNPLCGDDYFVYLKKDAQGKIQSVGFQGQGCAISKSSASMMTAAIDGKEPAEALALKDAFLNLLTKESVSDQDREKVGRLKIFEGVKQFPIRVKCATLAWRALEEALKNNTDKILNVTTEE